MKLWIYVVCLFPLFGQANQMAIELVDGAYPKLTLRINTLAQPVAIKSTQLFTLSSSDSIELNLPASKVCIADKLMPLRGRLQVVELAWAESIQQQLLSSKHASWQQLPLQVNLAIDNSDCAVKQLILQFPNIEQFVHGWGRLSVTVQNGVNAHGFFLMHQVKDVYLFKSIAPDSQRAQHYWLKYYNQ